LLDLDLVVKANKALRAGNIHGALTYLERFFNEQVYPTDASRTADAFRTLKCDYIQDLEEAVNTVREDYCLGTYAANVDEFHQDIEATASNFISNEEDAQKCLLFSDNANAVYMEHGEASGAGDWQCSFPWQGLAYSAFKADMREELISSGVNLDRTPPDSDERAIECCSCGEYRIGVPKDDTCIACHEEAGNEPCEKCGIYWDPDELDEDELCTKCTAE
jgi:hypothetical protein